MSKEHFAPAFTATVLVVDDNAGNRLLLASQLRLEGYRILEAESGLEAIDIARSQPVDIILLDVMMPNLNGFETCARLKADPATEIIPVIMITALRDVQYRIKGIEVGAEEFLSRPHIREELIVRVRTLIQFKRTRQRLMEERNRLRSLYEISQATTAGLDLPTLIQTVLTRMQTAVSATSGSVIVLPNGDGDVYRYRVPAGSDTIEKLIVTPEILERGLAGSVITHQQTVIVDDIDRDPRWHVRALENKLPITGSVIVIPLNHGPSTIGVLGLNHPEVGFFTAEHRSLLETIGAQVAAAIQNAALFARINEERSKMASVLAQTSDAIVITNEARHVVMVNQSAEQLLGLTTAVVGQPLHNIPVLEPLLPQFDAAQQRPVTVEVTLESGRTLLAGISRIDGVGFAAVMQDVTQLKAAEVTRLDAERREKELAKSTLSRYMGPELAERVLVSDPGLAAQRTRRRAVVLYADLRDWTSGMMMRMPPDAVIEQLNEFFSALVDVARAHRGTVFELTGDEILVGFNALFDQPNGPFLAIETAVAMQQRFATLRDEWHQQYGTQVGLGIGIDQGDVVVGSVGTEYRMNFRMVGEVMSRGHRLVDIAQDGEIVVSETIFGALKRHHPDWLTQMPFTALGAQSLKGIAQPIQLYSVRVAR